MFSYNHAVGYMVQEMKQLTLYIYSKTQFYLNMLAAYVAI